MDVDPLPIIKKRQSRQIRAHSGRLRDDDAPSRPETPTDDSRPATPEASPATLAAKLKKKSKLTARLSFGGDEEEGPSFNVKKSTLSRNLSLRPHPSLSADSAPSTPSQRPTYSAADLSSLKSSTPMASARKPPRNGSDFDEDAAADVSGLSLGEYGQTVVEDEMDIDGTNGYVDAEEIPTQSHIASAKQKRTAARLQPSAHPLASATSAEEYISLDVSRPAGNDRDHVELGPHPESRLMREDDEIGEGDDEAAEYTGAQERIAIGRKAREREAQKRRADIGEVIEEVEGDSEDSEGREWELAQVRRAAPSRPTPPPADAKPQPYRPPPIPTSIPIPTLAAPTARLSLLMEDISVRHAQNTKALAGVEKEREEMTKNEARVRKEVETVGQRWGEAKILREWVEGLAEFLDLKFPMLETLEEEQVSLLAERAGMITQRRQEDDSDDVALFLGIPPPPSVSDDQEDELGRAPPDDSAHSATRRARRIARMARRSARPLRTTSRQAHHEDDEGLSTDAELSPSDNADLLAALADLSSRVSGLLSDVRSEEFRDPRKGVGRRFSEWREKSREEYVNAWGGLAAVGAWEFWARLEMVGWNPIEDERSLDSFDWYDALYDYSRPGEPDDDPMQEHSLGPDGDLVSSLVSSAVVPRLCTLIEGGAFDPYSARHVRRLVDLTEQVEACIGTDADKFKLVLRAVVRTFNTAIASTQALVGPLLALPVRATFDPAAIPARHRFLVRRLKLLSNLISWRKYGGGAEIEVDKLVNQVLVPIGMLGWDARGEDVLRKVVKVLPPQLVPAELRVRF